MSALLEYKPVDSRNVGVRFAAQAFKARLYYFDLLWIFVQQK